MNISCIIIEDQAPAQRVLKKYIDDIGTIDLKGTFTDALSALEYLQQHSVDLIFLDIHLPKISGINFLNILSSRPKVIFTTAFSEYAIKGYELDVVDYLLKPFSFERFVKAVTKVMLLSGNNSVASQPAPQKTTDHHFIFVKSNNDYLKIEIANIQYIKSDGDYTQVFTSGKKYFVSYPLKFWHENLPGDKFCQIHKSYIIHVQFVNKVSGNQVFIDAEALPIGRTFRDMFFANYLNMPPRQ